MSKVRSLPMDGNCDRSAAFAPIPLRRVEPEPGRAAPLPEDSTPLPEVIMTGGLGHPAERSQSELPANSPPNTTTPDPVLEQIEALRQIVRELQVEVGRSLAPTPLRTAVAELEARTAVRQLQRATAIGVLSAQPSSASPNSTSGANTHQASPASAADPHSNTTEDSKFDRIAHHQMLHDRVTRVERPPLAGIVGLRHVARPSSTSFTPVTAVTTEHVTFSQSTNVTNSIDLSSSSAATISSVEPTPPSTTLASKTDVSDSSELFPVPSSLPWNLRLRDGNWWLGIVWQAACVISLIGAALAIPLWLSDRPANSQAWTRTYGSIDSQSQDGLPRGRLVELLPDPGTRVATLPDTTADSTSTPAVGEEPRLVGPLDEANLPQSDTGARR